MMINKLNTMFRSGDAATVKKPSKHRGRRAVTVWREVQQFGGKSGWPVALNEFLRKMRKRVSIHAILVRGSEVRVYHKHDSKAIDRTTCGRVFIAAERMDWLKANSVALTSK